MMMATRPLPPEIEAAFDKYFKPEG